MTETAEELAARIRAQHEAAQRPLREGRAGDSQPMPTGNDLPLIHDLVQRDINARMKIGIERYGHALQAHNGRDALMDAYEELLDAAVYIRQVIYERDGR